MVAALFSSILQLLEIVVAEEKKRGGWLPLEVVEAVQLLKEKIDVLKDADKKISTVIARGYMDELTDAAYDSVDVLDELITTLQINRVGKTSNLKPKVGSYVTHKVVTPRDIALILKKIKKSLNLIEMGAVPVHLGVRFNEQYRGHLECLCTRVHGSGLIGRHEIMDSIVRSLLDGPTEEQRKLLKTISVVGMGGVGKTALAEHVYHKVWQHFDNRIWVCVSNVFDEINVAKAIIAQVEHVAVDSLDSFPLAMLHERMRSSIEGKKFLLVLDDVQTDDMQHWEGLLQTLKHGAPGSRIFLTTRKDTVANMMKDSCVFHLEPLSDDHCWMLLSETAFYERGEQERRDLEDVGKRISKKCKGLPLAAKTLGDMLRFKSSKEEWEKILQNEIWRSDIEHQKDFVSLLLSYYDLPLPLRECFKYCAVFPKGFVYDGETMIYHWMAHGYLGWENGEDLELKGREYIRHLAACCFFQDFLLDTDGPKSTWKMHDIMHDFAQFLMINDGIVIDELMNPGGNSMIDFSLTKARYLTALIPEGRCLPTSVSGAEMLRSLVIISGENAITNEAVRVIFNQAKRIRLVDFGCHNALVDTIPKEIGKLFHLRHINLSGSKIKGLPRSLCELFNLQYLNLHNCESLENLPDEIGNLIHLRHINLSGSKIKGLPRSLCELLNLQYLNLHNCESLENLPDEIGNLIHLRDINLSGSKIKGLPRSLCELLNLQYLNLHNCESLENLPDEIGNMSHLEHINLSGSKIKVLPRSLCELFNLQYLNLHNCQSLENLPDEVGNLIHLKHINLGGSKIKRLPRSFYKLHNLQYLNLGNCEALENLPDDIRSLIQLRHINLSGSKIKELPRSLCELHNLQYLNLDSCEALESLPDEIGKLINLEYLGTLHCYKLACYPKSARGLTNLRQLRGIVLRADRNDLKEFALGDLENLNYLRELSIVLKGNAVDDKELKRAKFENKTDLNEFNVE